MIRRHIGANASSLAIALAAVLAPAAVSAQESAAGQDSEAPREAGLEDIVVTARKVAENLQDVPVAVTAFSGAALQEQSALKLSDLSAMAPGLSIASKPDTSGAVLFALRGQVQTSSLATVDPSVGVYVDGIYWARATGINSDLLDVSSLQVLKGPQGTLFGRNTTGGAILIETNAPDTSELSGEISGTYGRFDYKSARVILNVPVVEDRVAVRMAYERVDSDGYFTNLQDPGRKGGERDRETARIKLLANIADDTSLLLSANFYKASYADLPIQLQYVPRTSFSNLQVGSEVLGAATCFADTDACFAAGQSALDTFISQYSRSDAAPVSFQNFTREKTGTYSAELRQGLGFGEFKLTGGYRSVKGNSAIDYDGSPFHLSHLTAAVDLEQWSVEVQLTGKAFSDRLDFAAGLFYFDESGLDGSLFTAVPALAPAVTVFNGDIQNRSKGIYGQASYRLSDRLSLTGGLRWSQDKKSVAINNGNASGDIFGLQPGSFVCTVTAGCPTTRGAKFSGISYTLGLDYRFTDDIMAYVKTARGFRSGGVNLRETTSLPNVPVEPFRPEEATSYEVGLKSEFLDRRLRFNGAAYYTTVSDLQRTFILSDGATAATIAANAEKAEFYGFEGELQALLVSTDSDSLTFGASVANTHPKYVDYVDLQTGFDRSRESFQNIPRWQFAVSGSWEHRFGANKASLRADYVWEGAYPMNEYNYYVDANGVARDASTGAEMPLDVAEATYDALEKKAGGVLNARAAIAFDDGRYELALFGRNILNNRQYYVTAVVNPIHVSGVRREPATYGVSATFRF